MKNLAFSVMFTIVASMALISINACNKDYSPGGTGTVSDTAGSVSGLVTDINNSPLANATVGSGSFSTTTAADGTFKIKAAAFTTDTGFILVTATGFFDGSRKFPVNSHVINQVKLSLVPKTVSGNFVSSSGGLVNVTGGGSLNFGAESIVDATNGTVYSGTVSVASYLLNPSDPNFKNSMPGNTGGINSNNKATFIKPLSMVSVELQNSSGGMLQLAGNKTATITLPIAPSQQAAAPSTIPLWYFDETASTWKQQGRASKLDNNYVGTVSHFTVWTAAEDSLFTASDTSYFNLTMNGADYSWTGSDGLSATLDVDSNNLTLFGTTWGGSTSLSGGFSGNIPGTYQFSLNVGVNDSAYFESIYTATITSYGDVGGYITGNSSGWLWHNTGLPSPAVDSFQYTCSFSILRKN